MHYSNLDRNEMLSLLWLAFRYENKEAEKQRERGAEARAEQEMESERTNEQ